MRYQVIVGNIGKVFESDDLTLAMTIYQDYIDQSICDYGRVTGSPVTITDEDDGEPILEYASKLVDMNK